MITHDRHHPGTINTRICKGPGTAHKEYPVPHAPRRSRDRSRRQERRDNRTGEKTSSRYTEAVLMPRRPAKIVRDIPLCLIPGMVKRGVSIHGARLKRMIVWESRSHFYNISIRTKPVRKERKGSSARCGTGADLPEPNLADRESSGRDPEDTGPDDGSGGELE